MFKMMMCREMTRLMSKRLDAPLNFQEKLSLKLHLSMCDACRNCDKQFFLLHEAGQRFGAVEAFEGDEPSTHR